jgi:serine protease Do
MRNRQLQTGVSVAAFIAAFGCAHASSPVHSDSGAAQAATVRGAHSEFNLGGSASLPDVVARVLPSVVSISSTRVSREVPSMFPFENPFFHQFFGQQHMMPREFKEHGLGSGVVVQPNVILTNNHVIEGAEEIKVTASNKQVFNAKVVGADPKSDLAVLRLEGVSSKLQAITWGDSTPLRLGDFVLAIGNPFGVGETVTSGIVSAMGRTGLGILDYENFIQTDAAINPGNSGGALVNSQGELIGINTAILSKSGGYQGVGFAIPSNTARPIMDSLLKSGKVTRGWLGVGIQDLTADLAEALKLPDATGVLVSSIQPNTPAAKAGLSRGDVILKVNGESIDSTGKLRNLIAADGAGAKVTLQIRRDSKTEDISLVLGELPGSVASVGEHGASGAGVPGSVDGLSVEPLTPAFRDKYDIPKDVNGGVAITGVEPRSKAAWAGVKLGDVVLEVNRKPVSSVEQFKTEWNRNKNQVVLLVQRGDSTLFVAIQK